MNPAFERLPAFRHATLWEAILFVEDEDTVRELSVEFLSSMGYKVLPAACGDEALALAKAHRGKIDAMISDVVMPHISGPRLSEQLAPQQPTMKVLYVSGYSETVVRRKGVSSTDLLIQKPYPLGLLATKLRETLEQPKQAQVAAAR